jgi:hypothetical protein
MLSLIGNASLVWKYYSRETEKASARKSLIYHHRLKHVTFLDKIGEVIFDGLRRTLQLSEELFVSFFTMLKIYITNQ